MQISHQAFFSFTNSSKNKESRLCFFRPDQATQDADNNPRNSPSPSYKVPELQWMPAQTAFPLHVKFLHKYRNKWVQFSGSLWWKRGCKSYSNQTQKEESKDESRLLKEPNAIHLIYLKGIVNSAFVKGRQSIYYLSLLIIYKWQLRWKV
jgi:hypothetical protein